MSILISADRIIHLGTEHTRESQRKHAVLERPQLSVGVIHLFFTHTLIVGLFCAKKYNRKLTGIVPAT